MSLLFSAVSDFKYPITSQLCLPSSLLRHYLVYKTYIVVAMYSPQRTKNVLSYLLSIAKTSKKTRLKSHEVGVLLSVFKTGSSTVLCVCDSAAALDSSAERRVMLTDGVVSRARHLLSWNGGAMIPPQNSASGLV